MRKALIVLALLLLPSALWAQGALTVSSITGSVEWKAAAAKRAVPLTKAVQSIQAGDELITGAGAQLILTAPDGSYMVVSENSKIVVEDFWSGNFKSIMNLMLGQVRFYIQKLGGRPNPYSVRTPTALIAVRGTTFDVLSDAAQMVEVRCLDGQVTVESFAFPGREVVLNPGMHTLVVPGERPLTPVRNDAELNRQIKVRPKNVPDNDVNAPNINVFARDNERGNRTANPQFGNSGTNGKTERAKPALTFPQ